jgi:GTPase Era involved in 16S rRNA processing
MTKKRVITPIPLRVAVVGHFQVGKSTLINCFLRERLAACGDTTCATTSVGTDYVSRCGRVVFVDTPGVNAENPHDAVALKELERSDAALLIVRSTHSLEEAVLKLVTTLSRRRMAVAVAVNCWDDRIWHDGDPEKVNPTVVETIQSQIQTVGINTMCFERVNIEWAAAARQCLDEERSRILHRNTAAQSFGAGSLLEKGSRLEAIERFFLPHPFDAFSPNGFEAKTLAGNFIVKRRL